LKPVITQYLVLPFKVSNNKLVLEKIVAQTYILLGVIVGYKDKKLQSRYMREWYKNNKARQRKTVRERRHRNAEWFLEYKQDLKCEECQENHPACLDFHHLDFDEKEKNVGQMIWQGYKQEAILEEIAKCKVLCSNCHRKVHWDKEVAD